MTVGSESPSWPTFLGIYMLLDCLRVYRLLNTISNSHMLSPALKIKKRENIKKNSMSRCNSMPGFIFSWPCSKRAEQVNHVHGQFHAATSSHKSIFINNVLNLLSCFVWVNYYKTLTCFINNVLKLQWFVHDSSLRGLPNIYLKIINKSSNPH